MRRIIPVLFLLILSAGSLFAQNKYAIGMFHFNLQYVAGDYRIENRIIRESLYPVLLFFEKNPRYKSDIEIQGYAIEVLAEEHPKVLTLLKKLVKRGQIELVIAHYSDQFFIAYPALDLQKSIEISDQILEKHGLKRSRVFFGQEIQWSPGLAYALKGKYDVVVTSSDPHGYYRGHTLPLVNVKYGDNQILGLIGGGEKKLNKMEWTWAFLDDGEVFNTTDYNSNFYRVPEQEQKNIDHFKKLAKEGYKFVTMSELVEKIKNDSGYIIPDYPFVPEGTWNMNVCGPFMWMGKQRSGVETDGITRALSYEARGEVLMVEKLIYYAEKKGEDVSELRKLLLEAWKHLLLSEVSDASGWTPWLVEVQYTDNEVASARMALNKIMDQLKKMLPVSDKPLLVSTFTGDVTEDNSIAIPEYKASFLPLVFSVRAASYKAEIRQAGDDLYRFDIICERPEDGAVEIVFETASDGLYYSAGTGEETMVEIPIDLKHDPAFTLSNGFIFLNNGYNLIKDCTVEHLAATWRMKEKKLVFREELREGNNTMKMRFYIKKGLPEEGLKLGNALNTWPSYFVKISKDKISYQRVLPEDGIY
jgi:hypothetical protein